MTLVKTLLEILELRMWVRTGWNGRTRGAREGVGLPGEPAWRAQSIRS